MQASDTAGEAGGGIVTLCRDCVFAEYSGNEQVGCDFDRLEKFEENGAEVVGQDDGQRRYMAIRGRFCNACRNRDWAADKPPPDWAAIAAQEFRVRCSFLVYIDGMTEPDEVRLSLDSVLDQGTVPAYKVVLLMNGGRGTARDYVRMIREKGTLVPWEVRDLVVDQPGSSIDYGQAVDIGVKHINKSTFYCVARAGYRWPPSYLTVLNHAINYEMTRAVALLPDEAGNGLLMDVSLHNHLLNGNKGQPVLEKLLEVAGLEETRHMVKTWDELRELCG